MKNSVLVHGGFVDGAGWEGVYRILKQDGYKDPPPGAPVPPILPPQDEFLFLDRAKFPASFAADVDAQKAAFMADSQVPWGLGAISGVGQIAHAYGK